VAAMVVAMMVAVLLHAYVKGNRSSPELSSREAPLGRPIRCQLLAGERSSAGTTRPHDDASVESHGNSPTSAPLAFLEKVLPAANVSGGCGLGARSSAGARAVPNGDDRVRAAGRMQPRAQPVSFRVRHVRQSRRTSPIAAEDRVGTGGTGPSRPVHRRPGRTRQERSRWKSAVCHSTSSASRSSSTELRDGVDRPASARITPSRTIYHNMVHASSRGVCVLTRSLDAPRREE
jgi:hypothetical protein